MKLACLLLALLAAIASVNGAANTVVVGAGGVTVVQSSPTVETIQNATSNITITSTGTVGTFIGQPTIKGTGGGTVTIGNGTAVVSPTANVTTSPTANITTSPTANVTTVTSPTVTVVSPTANVTTSPTANVTTVTSPTVTVVSPTANVTTVTSPTANATTVVVSTTAPTASVAVVVVATTSPNASSLASPTASLAASPNASGLASPTASLAASPTASGLVSPTASLAASPTASGLVSPTASPAASPTASGLASPTASLAASPTASGLVSPTASLAASPTASGLVSPTASLAASPSVLASPTPTVTVSAAEAFPPMPSYGVENFPFTCPNLTAQAAVEVSFEPLLVGIGPVSSIKFAGCPSLMYVATKAGQIFQVTLNNASTAVEQVRLILDLSSQIATSGSSNSSSTASASSSSSATFDQPGLLGMAFPSDFNTTGLFYVYFSTNASSSATSGTSATASASPAATAANSSSPSFCANESALLNHVNRLAEYHFDNATGIANFSRTLLDLRWPFSNNNGDNSLEFAPDTKFLFLGVGDGGSSFDPFENAQNPDVLLGKVLVLDLNTLSANASCNATVLRLSELQAQCPNVASATTTFASGLHAPAGFEFLSPSPQIEAANCPSAAGASNATASASNATSSANATASTNATSASNATASANLTLADLAPRLIAPDRGQGMYDEINIMEEIGANYGWDIMEGWTCVNQSLDLCPQSTSGNASTTAASANATSPATNATSATNATAATNATSSANATLAGSNTTSSANATGAQSNVTTSTTTAILPAAVIPHNCRNLFNPQAVLGGRLYLGTELDPMLQGAYLFGAITSLQNGNESVPSGNGALYFLRPESFSGNAVIDLTMCPASANATSSPNATAAGTNATSSTNATAAGTNATSSPNATAAGANTTSSTNATAAGTNATSSPNATATGANATSSANSSLSGITTTGSGVNMSFIPNSRLEVFPITINYQFFPTQHFFTALGANAARSQVFVGVSSSEDNTGGLSGIFRLIPLNEGPQNPAVISATNLQPGQIVFSATNATASASLSPSPSAAVSPSANATATA